MPVRPGCPGVPGNYSQSYFRRTATDLNSPPYFRLVRPGCPEAPRNCSPRHFWTNERNGFSAPPFLFDWSSLGALVCPEIATRAILIGTRRIFIPPVVFDWSDLGALGRRETEARTILGGTRWIFLAPPCVFDRSGLGALGCPELFSEERDGFSVPPFFFDRSGLGALRCRETAARAILGGMRRIFIPLTRSA